MEMPEQELPVVFSQMLQMFPNIPQDIIWMYVQQYSRDIEKCAQMLNLLNSKYTGLKSNLDTSRNLNECNDVLQVPHIILQTETILDNNNDVPLSNKLPLQSNEGGVIKRCTKDKLQTKGITNNFPSYYSPNVVHENHPLDSSVYIRGPNFINFNEPLILDIVPDDDDISHSWRPNVTADVLCSDLFAPSPMADNFQINSNLVPSLNFEYNPEIRMDPEGTKQEPWRFPNSSNILYTQQNGRHYETDIPSYLHYQKSQMNVMRYEVIKAKIELSNLKECIEKLSLELNEKMQSKSVQDIEELNQEIVQLRIECQCLCTEVDKISDDQGLLGEVDERCYGENEASSNNAAIQKLASDQSKNSYREDNSADILEDSNRWQCSRCTFANHSDINICEMCSLPKPGAETSPFLQATPSSCHCNSKEKSLSVES